MRKVRVAAGVARYAGTVTTAVAGVEVVFDAASVAACVLSAVLVVPNAVNVLTTPA